METKIGTIKSQRGVNRGKSQSKVERLYNFLAECFGRLSKELGQEAQFLGLMALETGVTSDDFVNPDYIKIATAFRKRSKIQSLFGLSVYFSQALLNLLQLCSNSDYVVQMIEDNLREYE